jgi:hypothetical protein
VGAIISVGDLEKLEELVPQEPAAAEKETGS